MNPAMTHSEILEKLLTDGAFRAAFNAGTLTLPPEFGTIDKTQLAGTAAQLRKDLIHKQFRGSGGVLERFGGTLRGLLSAGDAAAVNAALDDVFARFVASEAYRTYREWPRTGDGACLEEAFYRFAEAEDIGDPAVREQEFLMAVVRAILLSPEPGFAVPTEVSLRDNGSAVAIARRGPRPFVVAATARGLVQGAITPLIADLVAGADPSSTALKHSVQAEVVAEALTRLRALGIVG